MATFGDLKAEIADEVDDTTGEYSEQIERAVLAAIRYCERNTYYFNETRDVTFSTVASQDWYGAADNSNIPTLLRINAVYRIDGAGQVDDMIRRDPHELELLADTSSAEGEPTVYAYFNRQIRLYPIPNDVWTIRLQLGPYRLTTLSADSDENAWLTEAWGMVKARAKYILQKDVLKDPNLAAEALNDYQDQHDALTRETDKRNGSGYVRATSF